METLLQWDRELFYALNHGLSHPLLDPVMWLITSLGLGWVQMLGVLVATLTLSVRRRPRRRAASHTGIPLSGLDSPVQAQARAHRSDGEDAVVPSEGQLTRDGGDAVVPSPWRLVFLPALVAFTGSGLTAQLIKRTLPRLRPSNLPDAIVAPDERIFHNSFPSGHTTTAFALAFWVFLLTRGTRYRLWGYGALVLAGLVGLSRIYRGVHYPSDVLAGALIGVLWGAVAYFTLNARRASAPPAAESTPDSASACPRD